MSTLALSYTDLQRVTGYTQARALERCLRRCGIRYFPGKDGPWTTMDLVNAAGGLQVLDRAADTYPPDLRPVTCQ